MSIENMKARIELQELLAEAEDDVKNQRIAPVSETFDDLRELLKQDYINIIQGL